MRAGKVSSLGAFLIYLACAKSSNSSSDSTTSGALTPTVSAQATAGSMPCPPTGQWSVCSLEKRMKRAGLVARRIPGDTTARPGFTPKPIAYALGRDSRLELFLYESEKSLQRDVAKVDTLRGVPLGTPADSASRPVWIRSANVAALLFTRDPREADRVSLAITAGPPQPSR